ncbi:MAG TPA: hypothetical protein VGZ01_12405 [Trinickia sp.]|jgi:hypothetical protein|nr:hypothetical protein [Trinickia sp.]
MKPLLRPVLAADAAIYRGAGAALLPTAQVALQRAPMANLTVAARLPLHG